MIAAVLVVTRTHELVLAWAGVRAGWRYRLRSHLDMAPLLAAPTELSQPPPQAQSGIAVGTTSASSGQNRVGHEGLGARPTLATSLQTAMSPAANHLDRPSAEKASSA